MKRLAPALVALLALALILNGCGGNSNEQPQLTVSAAASLTKAFETIGQNFDDAQVRFQFAGSDALAAQIEQGARPSVFASANTKLPDELYAKGLTEQPVVFTSNRLVIAVPKDSQLDSIDDLTKAGVKIAVGSQSVPVGSYTRKVLQELPADQRKLIAANFASDEPDVKGVIGKVMTGAVDAGFVYATDVTAAGPKVRMIAVPASLEPTVQYAAAVVKGAPHAAAAREFVANLTRPAAQETLESAGFTALPPR